MRQATPLDLLRVGTDAVQAVDRATPSGAPLYVPGSAPERGERTTGTGARTRATGQLWKGGGRVSKTTGRMFMRVKGGTSSCSAAVVAGRRMDLLVTAGHCLYYRKRWSKDVVFVPGYRSDRAPHGIWDAKQIWVTRQWHRKPFAGPSTSYKYDVGFVALRKRQGRHVAQQVGAQGIAFNTPATPQVSAFGYPAMFQFNGRTLRHCAGPSRRDRYERSNYLLRCRMNGGASGGPWLTRFDPRTGVGYQIGVNSYVVGTHRKPSAMGAPSFNPVIKRVYQQLQKRG